MQQAPPSWMAGADPARPAPTTFDEASMEQSRSFVKALQELKNLRPQLYSASEYCEKSYLHSEQKHVVLDNLKDYAVRALVNAVDHLGTVAFKLTDLYEQQASELSTIELKVASLNQQVLTCQTYTDKEGLRQQQMIGTATRHHKHYVVPASGNKMMQTFSEMQTDTEFDLRPKPYPSDSLFKEGLARDSAPNALISVSGDGSIEAADVVREMTRLVPADSQWKWEAVPSGDKAFVISLPSQQDLDRIVGMEFMVRAKNVSLSVSAWKKDDISPAMELTQVWVHVEGVPHELRHFLGLWGVGSFIGNTIDVDLLSLRRRGLVRILVGMYDTNVFYKDESDELKSVSTILVIKLKGYQFKFELEKDDFVPETDFRPFMWRKPDDSEDNGNGNVDGGGPDMGANKRSKNTSTSAPSDTASGGSVPMQEAPVLSAKADREVSPTVTSPRRRLLTPSSAPGLLGEGPLAARPGLHLHAVGADTPGRSASPASASTMIKAGLGGGSPSTLSGDGQVSGGGPGGVTVGGKQLNAAHIGARTAPLADPRPPPARASPTFGQRLEGVSTPPSPPPVVSPMITTSTPTPSPTPTHSSAAGEMAQLRFRRSGRHTVAADGASRTDEDSLAKAMRLQAAKNLDFTKGYLPVCTLTPGVVYSSETGTPRPIYGGVFASGAGGEGYFFPSWVAA